MVDSCSTAAAFFLKLLTDRLLTVVLNSSVDASVSVAMVSDDMGSEDVVSAKVLSKALRSITSITVFARSNTLDDECESAFFIFVDAAEDVLKCGGGTIPPPGFYCCLSA